VLARAVADGVLTPTEADLIGTTRLESVRIAQWATDHKVGEWAAYKARRRAEIRLAAYLRDGMTDCDPADDLINRVATAVALDQAAGTRSSSGRTAAKQESIRGVSKGDSDCGLQEGGEVPHTVASPEVRQCA
jgi:hypothetical protein